MRDPAGSCSATWETAVPSLNGYLEDYAYLVEALLDAVRGEL